MGNSVPVGPFSSKSTALQVLNHFGSGEYLKGKTAIVTGGNSGIGLETCKVLAHGGARVILCTRSAKNGYNAIEEEIKKEGHGGYVVSDTSNIIVKELDLNSLQSVKNFAQDFLATEERLDFLVLNAGVMAIQYLEFTEDGFEKQIGINLFGHFYLTQLLLPKMKAQDFESRIVVLASTAHTMGNVVVSDLHFKNGRNYSAWGSYGQSKAADILFAKSLADKLKDTKVSAASVHPGVIQTNLWRSSFFSGGLGSTILSAFISDKTIPQGAATTVWACLSPSVMTTDRGAYLNNCAPELPNAECQDVDGTLREALWKETEKQIAEAAAKLK